MYTFFINYLRAMTVPLVGVAPGGVLSVAPLKKIFIPEIIYTLIELGS